MYHSPYELFATTGRDSRYEANFTSSCANGAQPTQNVSDLREVPLLSAPATTSDSLLGRGGSMLLYEGTATPSKDGCR